MIFASTQHLKLKQPLVKQPNNIFFLLIDDDGKLNTGALPPEPPSGSGKIYAQQYRLVYNLLKNDTSVPLLLRRFTAPAPNRYIESLIRASLSLKQNETITTAHIRRAVLSALLTPLRQNIGSCFATAPAILIQTEQPKRILLDLYDLMTTSKLKRTMGGVEYTAPIALLKVIDPKTDHALLRMWEYTLASFTDYKIEFSRWNLYASLGFKREDDGGIGPLLYQSIDEKLEEANQKAEKWHQEYVVAVEQVNATQTLLRQADSSERARQRKAELEARLAHARSCKDLLDDGQENAKLLSQLAPFLLTHYSNQLQDYFQEVYDPEVVAVDPNMYEDSPAGFRLVCKYGRSDPIAWKPITNSDDYIDALIHFFRASEPTILAECKSSAHEKAVEAITTQIIHHLRTEVFIASALKRMAKRHKAGTKQEKAEKKPWSYTSGGTMSTLVQCYYSLETPLTKEERVVTSPQDLLIFLLDTMKSLPYKITKRFEKNPNASLLMESPTHAFLFKPGLAPFKEGWLDSGFTYTWVRDHVKAGRYSPLLFADSNWADFYFGFYQNPKTQTLELWRFDPEGKNGYPMSDWSKWLDGSQNRPWIIYTDPEQNKEKHMTDLSWVKA